MFPWPQVGAGSKPPAAGEDRNPEPRVSTELTLANGLPDGTEVLVAAGTAERGCRGIAHTACHRCCNELPRAAEAAGRQQGRQKAPNFCELPHLAPSARA